jgi:hypothetical protein
MSLLGFLRAKSVPSVATMAAIKIVKTTPLVIKFAAKKAFRSDPSS